MIEVFQDKAGEWRFRVKGNNGEIVAQSEGYTRSADAFRGARTLLDIAQATNAITFIPASKKL